MLAALALALTLQAEVISEIRVHGNATLSDDAVIQLAGVSVGSPLGADGLAAIEKRLKASGRFDEVQVRQRYRTLAMDQVSVVLLVHERPGVTAAGEPPGMLRRLRSHLMFLPILHYDDGYGWTYGARTSAVDVAGKGTRLSVPLSWGATRRAAVEIDRTFQSGPLTRLSGSYGIAQRENPHFGIDDRRTALAARAERRLFGAVTLGADLARTDIRFAPLGEAFWSTGADVTLDTRRDLAYPVDAVLATAAWGRIGPIGAASFAASVDRYRLDARGYKRLFGQNVIAVRAEYDASGAPLPSYEQWLLGGTALRGTPSGAFAGDTRLLLSAELRVPISSPLSVGKVGFNAFIDAGATAPHGTPILDQKRYRGIGAGVWLTTAILNLNLDVAHSPERHGTRVHFGTGFSF